MLPRLVKSSLLTMAIMLVLSACGGATDTPAPSDGEEATGEGDASSEPIVLALEPYDYVQPPTYLAKKILEDRGHEVEIQKGQTGILWAAMADGEIDGLLDVWEPNVSGSLIKKYEGEFEMVGAIYSDTPIGAVVPEYMDDIDSIEQLNEMKDTFDGTIYSIEAETGTDTTAREMVDVYDLDYEIINSSEAGMVSQAKKMMANEEPVVFIGWRPHVMFRELDIKLLDDPKNVWSSDDCKIGVPLDLKERVPEAYTLFENMKMPIEEIERWLFEIEGGATPEELAAEWVEDNADTIETWFND